MGDSFRYYKPLIERHCVFIDCETTGTIPHYHEIIEIAVITPERESCIRTQMKHPERAARQALEVNGYSKEKWANAVPFEKIAHRVVSYLSDCIIVGHNVQFDIAFIKEACRRCNVDSENISHAVIDTQTLAIQHLVPKGLKRLKLQAVAKFLGIPFEEDDLHTALEDTRLAKSVYEKMQLVINEPKQMSLI